MCGRFTLTTKVEALAKRFAAEKAASLTVNRSVDSAQSPSLRPSGLETAQGHLGATLAPRFNIAPTQSVIVVNDTGQRQIVAMRWGLIPSWADTAN